MPLEEYVSQVPLIYELHEDWPYILFITLSLQYPAQHQARTINKYWIKNPHWANSMQDTLLNALFLSVLMM